MNTSSERDYPPLYSHYLASKNYQYTTDQLGLYFVTMIGIGVISKGFWRSWNIKKASEILQNGNMIKSNDMLPFHRYFSGLSSQDLKHPSIFRKIAMFKAVSKASFIIIGFATFVSVKNEFKNN